MSPSTLRRRLYQMYFTLEFENSNDVLPFEATTNSDILVYYVDLLNNHNQNRFTTDYQFKDQNLTPLINEINEYFTRYTEKSIQVYDNYFDQAVLNQLHAYWVSSQNNLKIDARNKGLLDYYSDDNLFPNWNDVLHKIGKTDHFDSLNHAIHKLERQFYEVLYSIDDKYFLVDNPFPTDRCTNDICNFRIAFNHLGRPLYDKFETLDDELTADDTNTFNELLGFVEISLRRPQTIPLSKEYIEWCGKIKRSPSGTFLNLGNLVDYKNKLTEYRQILYNNNSNSFTIKIEEK